VNFRNSDCVTTRVDYVESVGSAMCGNHAVSNFGNLNNRHTCALPVTYEIIIIVM